MSTLIAIPLTVLPAFLWLIKFLFFGGFFVDRIVKTAVRKASESELPDKD